MTDPKAKSWVRGFTAVAAVLGWAALALQLYLSMRLSTLQGQGLPGALITYFSFFTILTNILVALALTAALVDARSGLLEFFARPSVNAGIAACISLVGMAYGLLLRQVWDPQGLQLVADVLLHNVMPVVFVIYWLVAVPKGDLRWGHVSRWMLYPVVYFVYTMVRGAVTGAYPYHFIDADTLGYARAIGYALGILLGFTAISLLLVGLGRFLGAKGRVVDRARPF